MSALLDVTQLSLDVGARRVLTDVSLAVATGELHVLLGANGAGKSSLAYAIMGCAGYQPVTGRMRFAGEDIVQLPLHERARHGLALAWQEPARFEGLSVADYLAIGGKAEAAGDRGRDALSILNERAARGAGTAERSANPAPRRGRSRADGLRCSAIT